MLSSFAGVSAAEPGAACIAHHAAERWGAAIDCYQKLRAATGIATPWAYLEGDAELARHGDPSAAWRAAGAYFPARLRLAEWLINAGEDPGALVDELLAAQPGSARVHYAAGRARQSIEHLRRAVTLEPRYGQAHYELALALRRAGLHEEAARHFQAFRTHGKTSVEIDDPELDRVRALRVGAADHLLAGRRAEEANRLAEAREHYRQAALADPQLVQAHVNLIAVHGKLGDLGAAEASFREALRVRAATPEAHYNYGRALASVKRWQDAEDRFAAAVALNPHYADALNNWGTLLQARGERGEAEARWRAALAAQPQHPEANFNLARVLAEREPAQAERYFQAATASEGERTPAYRYYFAQYYWKAGRRDAARTQAQAAQLQAERYGQKDLADYLRDLLRQWQ